MTRNETQSVIPDVEDLYAAIMALGADETSLSSIIAESPEIVRRRLDSIDKSFLRALLRFKTGQAAIAHAEAVCNHLRNIEPHPVFLPRIEASRSIALPTNNERPEMPAFSDRAFDDWFAAQNVSYGLGLYGEKRSVYASDQFADSASPERRTIHMGIDVFAPAGTTVFAPIAGVVHTVAYNADPLDYGHTLIIEHETSGVRFYTLYGHLGDTLPRLCKKGQMVQAGQMIAHLGDWHENGGWAPHLHFQIITDLLDQQNGNFFGVGHESLWPVWQQICPDPNLILRLPASDFRV